MGAWLYILRCADGSYYTGTTRADLEQRIAEHQAGHFPGFTEKRRPVELAYNEYFDQPGHSAAHGTQQFDSNCGGFRPNQSELDSFN